LLFDPSDDPLERARYIVKYHHATLQRSKSAANRLHSSIQERLQKAVSDPFHWGLEAKADIPELKRLREIVRLDQLAFDKAKARLDQLEPPKPPAPKVDYAREAALRGLAELAELAEPETPEAELTLASEPSDD
jgi:hypothetical protein